MKYFQASLGMIWYTFVWISTASYLSISFAFLQDPRISNPPQGNLCEEKFLGKNNSKSIIHRLPNLKENESVTRSIKIGRSNTFGSISTKIYMAGGLSKDEECGLMGESVMSSQRSQSCIPSLAHGILCPETVNKMELATQGGRSNRAVKAFLDRYHKSGPMSCMELLSDPEILHHLTNTMRDLA